MRTSSECVTNGKSSSSSSGARIADDPARMTISPTAAPGLPFASAVKGGPYGAPGQTAIMTNPAATIGGASNIQSNATAAAGTIA